MGTFPVRAFGLASNRALSLTVSSSHLVPQLFTTAGGIGHVDPSSCADPPLTLPTEVRHDLAMRTPRCDARDLLASGRRAMTGRNSADRAATTRSQVSPPPRRGRRNSSKCGRSQSAMESARPSSRTARCTRSPGSDDDETIRCLDANTGKELWADKYSVAGIKLTGDRGYPGPRNSPVVGEGKVCTFGIGGRLSCYDAATGKLAWHHDTKGTPMFRTSTSPLIAEGKCILHTGTSGGGSERAPEPGKGELVAYDLAGRRREVEVERRRAGLRLADRCDVPRCKAGGRADRREPDRRRAWRTGSSCGRPRSRLAATRPARPSSLAMSSSAPGPRTRSRNRETSSRPSNSGRNAPRPHTTRRSSRTVSSTASGPRGQGWRRKRRGRQGGRNASDQALRPGRQDRCRTLERQGAARRMRHDSRCRQRVVLLSSDSNLVVFKPDKDEFKEVAKYKVADTPTWAMPILDGKRIYVKDADSLILWTLG